MSRRRVLLAVLILANVSIGFTQSLGDFAREERSRRNSFVERAPVPPVANTAGKRDAAKPDTADALVMEAIQVSGARRQLEETIETFRPSSGDGKIVDEALELDRLTQVMERSVSGAVTETTITNIIAWYGSPLGRKITAAELDAYSPDTPARFQRYATLLQQKAPAAEREQLVDSIGAAGLGAPRPPLDFDNGSWLLFVYDSLSDLELSNYLTFLNSPSATTFNAAIWDGIDAAFGDASQRLQERLAEKK